MVYVFCSRRIQLVAQSKLTKLGQPNRLSWIFTQKKICVCFHWIIDHCSPSNKQKSFQRMLLGWAGIFTGFSFALVPKKATKKNPWIFPSKSNKQNRRNLEHFESIHLSLVLILKLRVRSRFRNIRSFHKHASQVRSQSILTSWNHFISPLPLPLPPLSPSIRVRSLRTNG